MKRIEWVVKVSKFCNMRCRYCYEWPELSNKGRIELPMWRKIFTAVRDLHRITEERCGEPVESAIVWHGGEPLLHPVSYWQDVLDLQREIMPDESLGGGRVVHSVQTNLFSVSDEMLEFLRDNGIGIGVSYDHVSGVRLTAGGRETGEKVMENIARLRDFGFPRFGVVVTMAGHNKDHMPEIHDFLVDKGISFRVLPLFNGPDGRPMDDIDLSREDVNAALFTLFRHWFESGCPVEVAPLSGYLWTAVMHILDLESWTFDRSRNESVITVNTDGKLYEPVHRTGCEDLYFGDLQEQTIREILASDAYEVSLARNERDRQAICGACEYEKACNGYPIFATPDGSLDRQSCLTARPLTGMIETYLLDQGYDAAFWKDYAKSLTPAMAAE